MPKYETRVKWVLINRLLNTVRKAAGVKLVDNKYKDDIKEGVDYLCK
nr:MAG TPA: hypothetical protein [Caudoviricetes sp.]DAV33849.1 MAG TPA: hypothetical protein [Caudoviricetes sp.]